jgi:hypothetical protein
VFALKEIQNENPFCHCKSNPQVIAANKTRTRSGEPMCSPSKKFKMKTRFVIAGQTRNDNDR